MKRHFRQLSNFYIVTFKLLSLDRTGRANYVERLG
jgi:hypothetical protein